MAREHLKISATGQKKYFDIGVQPVHLAIGDKVWYFYPPKKQKLKSGWIGPFEVVECCPANLYRIRNVDTGHIRVVHVDKLRPYLEEAQPDFPASQHVDQETDNGTSEDEQRASSPSPEDQRESATADDRPRRTVRRPERFQDYVD